jgi:hypothetical protein
METSDLEHCVLDALEAAAVQGLCRDGQVEAAVGAVRALQPDLSLERALALVQRVTETGSIRP